MHETYAAATAVALQAIPAPGYRFVGWTGSCGGPATTTVTVSWIHHCSAVFNAIAPGNSVEDPRAKAGSLFVNSQPGDRVGLGLRQASLDPQIAVWNTGRNLIGFTVHVPGSASWDFRLAAPAGLEMRPGTYDNVLAIGSSTSGPRMNIVWTDALRTTTRACPSTLVGRFVVHGSRSPTPTSTAPSSFAIDFEQRCSPTEPALVGSVRYRSARSELKPFPAQGPAHRRTDSDLDGDGRSDLILQNDADGQLKTWFIGDA